MKNEKTEIVYVRNRRYGVLGVKNGWVKEVSNVSWNGTKPKLDIRDWDNNYTRMSRGITLSKEEARSLLQVLAGIDFENFYKVDPGKEFSVIRTNESVTISVNDTPESENSEEASEPEPVNCMTDAIEVEDAEIDDDPKYTMKAAYTGAEAKAEEEAYREKYERAGL